MTGKTVFVAGAYGTGKSTLCSRLADKLSIPAFSAGDLISEQNGEKYGANKAVADKDNNQSILARRVRKLNAKHECILLAGHFCIFNSTNRVERLPDSVFNELNLLWILLLEASPKLITEHLQQRDGKAYSPDVITELLSQEREQAKNISANFNCPLSVYQMTFSDMDAEKIAMLFKEVKR